MKCPTCHFENPDNVRFCGNCATPLHTRPDKPKGDGTMTMPSYVLQLVPGKVFDNRYQIIEEIGAGGMGRVYKAMDLKVHETVALKLIHPEVAFKQKNIDRFRNELRLTRKISHRNVCRMFDLHEGENAVYITMEYVQGEDLKNSLRMMGPFTIGKVVSVARQVCEGLKEAHHRGILHRDLKANNIILDREGNVHIMDFGIASSIETKGLTEDGVAIGTPTYMSPEQAGGKGVDRRSDIYSLGVILYEMVTGEAPFKGDSSLSIAMQHKFDPPRPPIEINHGIPEPLNRLILRCLEKKKENRYQAVDDILADLKPIEDGLTTGEKEITGRRMRSTTIMTSIKTFKVPGYLVVGAVLLFALAYVVGKALRSPPQSESEIRIAVLPFEYLGPDEGQDHVWGILAPQISQKLHARYKTIITTPDRSAEHFSKQGLSVTDLGQKLRVDHLVTGKISIDQGAVSLSVSLIDARNDRSLLGMNVSCSAEELYLNEVDRVIDRIGQELGLSATATATGAGAQRPSGDSLMLYVRGRDAERMYRDSWDVKYLEVARQHYRAAYDLDPEYPLYPWLLGGVYEQIYVETDDPSARDEMSSLYRKAYALDPNSAETNLGMGWEYFFQGDNDKAYTHFLRAVELDPKKFEVNYHVGGYLRSLGLYEKAIKYYSQALFLNPGEQVNPALRTLPDGSTLELRIICIVELGRFQEAAKELASLRDQIPTDLNIRFKLLNLLLRMDRIAEAEDELQYIKGLGVADVRIPFYQATVDAARKRGEDALSVLKEGYVPEALYLVTQIYCALGMKAEALAAIKEGIDVGLPKVQTYMFTYQHLINNPFYDLLRTEPEFQEIISAQKKIYDSMVAKFRDL